MVRTADQRKKRFLLLNYLFNCFFYNAKPNRLRANGKKIKKPGNSKIRAVNTGNTGGAPDNLTIQIDVNKNVWFITVYIYNNAIKK